MAASPRRWILLRGLGREAAHWGDFASDLNRALGGGSVVLSPDLPGAGVKFRERAPLDLKQYASRLMEETASREPAGLISLSLGAMVALEWAAMRPASVSRVVVINTSLGSQARPWERFTPEACRRSLSMVLALRPRAREAAILGLISNSEAKRKDTLDAWVRIAGERPVSMANYARQIAAAASARPDLGRITAPGLVLASRGDRLVRMFCSERLAAVLRWPLQVHESAGHDLPLDDPEWCAARIAEWSRTLSAQ